MDGNALYDRFYNHVERTLRQVYETQRGAIFSAARMICAALDRGGRFLVTGTGHSHMLAEEFYVRAGGLACVTPILPPEFMLHEHPLKSTAVERVPEYAHVILSLYGVKEQDVLFIASNSGRNGLIVELALGAKARGAAVIALTARAGMAGQPSRHASGLRLADAADLVIDNCGAAPSSAWRIPPRRGTAPATGPHRPADRPCRGMRAALRREGAARLSQLKRRRGGRGKQRAFCALVSRRPACLKAR